MRLAEVSVLLGEGQISYLSQENIITITCVEMAVFVWVEIDFNNKFTMPFLW